MSSVSSSGQWPGSRKGRRIDAQGVVFVWAVMQAPFEFVIADRIRAFVGVSSTDNGALSGW